MARKISIEVSETVFSLLKAIGGPHQSVDQVVGQLVDHAQQGVYRPGAWERGWLCQAFGYDWIERLEPGDPYGRPDGEKHFQRPLK